MSDQEKLWLRIDDDDEYEDHGQDFGTVADCLVEAGVHLPIYLIPCGIACEEYQGWDSIDLYWSERPSGKTKITELTLAEFQHLQRLIAERTKV